MSRPSYVVANFGPEPSYCDVYVAEYQESVEPFPEREAERIAILASFPRFAREETKKENKKTEKQEE